MVSLQGTVARFSLLLCAAFSAAPLLAEAPSTVSSKDFGKLSVGAAAVQGDVLLALAGQSISPALSLTYSGDFSLGSANCATPNSCSVHISFSPQAPGLRQSALVARDSLHQVVGVVLLHGIGLAPQISVQPGLVATVAGNRSWGYSGDGGAATLAKLANPQSVAIDPLGNLFIADATNGLIRKVSGQTITTLPGTSGAFQSPTGLALDGAGNIFVADCDANVVREINAASGAVTVFAGGGPSSGDLGDSGPATAAVLSGPSDVAVDAAGSVFIADTNHGLIRKVDPSGIIWTVAGGAPSIVPAPWGDGGSASTASLSSPQGVALDSGGNLYIADTGHHAIRYVALSSGVIITVAGNGNAGYGGDAGPAISATLQKPVGLTVDAAGDLYIADTGANVIREVNGGSGFITTVAGTPLGLSGPSDVALDSQGNVYIADYGNNIVRQLTPALQPLTFESVLVGLESAAQTQSITNTGNQPLDLSALAIAGPFKQDTTSAFPCSSASQILSGTECTLTIRSIPDAVGQTIGGLSIGSDSANANSFVQVSLAGAGVAGPVPQLQISPTSLNFSTQAVGSSSPVLTLSLTNTGSANLNISSVWLSGANADSFVLQGSNCGTVSPGLNCTVSVVFTPHSSGTQTAALAFTDTLANSPQIVALSGLGLGVPGISLNTTSIAFGNQDLALRSASQQVTVSNTGSAPLVINSVSVSAATAPEFTESDTCSGSPVVVGGSCTVSIAFTPAYVGLQTALLSISSNASNTPSRVNLSGIGMTFAHPVVPTVPINGDFESQKLAPWNVWQGSAYVGWSAHAGQHGLTTGTDTVVYQVAAGLVPGEMYTLSAWVLDANSSNRGASLALNGANGWEQSSFLPGTTWKQFSQSGIASPNGTLSLDLIEAPSSATLFWDDITLAPVPPPNGSFETGSLAPWNIWQGSAYVGWGSHTGQHSLAMSPGSVVFQNLTGLIPGQTYLMSAWVYATAPTTGTVTIAVNGALGWQQSVSQPLQQWTQITQIGVASVGGTLSIDLVTAANTPVIYWDDILVTPIPPFNGAFENGSVSPWKMWQGGASLTRDSHSGQFALVTDPSTILFQNVTGLIPWERYALAAWVKTSDPDSPLSSLALRGAYGWEQSQFAVGPNWQQVSEVATASPDGTLTVDLVTKSSSGKIFWDDVTFTAAPPANSGFESGSLTPWSVWSGSAYVGWAAHTGQHGLTTTANTIVFQISTGLVPGQRYYLSAWILASTPGRNRVSLALNGANGWEQTDFIPSLAWQQYTQSGTATADGKLSVDLVTDAAAGPIFWDDVTLTVQ